MFDRAGEAEAVDRVVVDLFDREYRFSQTIVRGKWRWGKIPQRFHPTLDEMIEMVLSHPAWKERKGFRVDPWASMFVEADERIAS